VGGVIQIRREILVTLPEIARRNAAVECCGLLAGDDGVVSHVHPAKNISETPATSYEIAPDELLTLMREIRAAKRELLGIYHSHPNGKNEPSKRDINDAYYPDAAYFILSPREGASKPVRAFSIRAGRSEELEIVIV
jgi:proteasome lid subunit RPN8/RPN11